jgi:hypothetical protein
LIEEAEHVQYFTTAERIGIQKGREEGRQETQRELLEQLLVVRFGGLPEALAASSSKFGGSPGLMVDALRLSTLLPLRFSCS